MLDLGLLLLGEYLIDLAEIKPGRDPRFRSDPTIQRGQCVVVYKQIAKLFGWHKSLVSKKLHALAFQNFVDLETDPGTQLVRVTIRNYERYQDVPEETGTVSGTVPERSRNGPGTGFIIEEVKNERLKDGGSGLRAAAVPNPPAQEKKPEPWSRPPSPFDEMRPLTRGSLKPPPPCPRCKKPLSYFETRSGSRYAADRWYCDEKAEGCGGKFPEVEWEDPGEGKPLRRRKKEWRSKADQDHRPELKPFEVSARFLPPIPREESSREG